MKTSYPKSFTFSYPCNYITLFIGAKNLQLYQEIIVCHDTNLCARFSLSDILICAAQYNTAHMTS